jgi:hypothetical protein
MIIAPASINSRDEQSRAF